MDTAVEGYDADIAAHPLLSKLSQEQRVKLVRASTILAVGARKTVLRQGACANGVYFLISGSVRIFHREGDKQLLVKLLAAPAMFGELEVVSGSSCLDGVVTVERSRLMLVPSAVFRQLMESVPAFTSAIARDLAARLRIAATHQTSLAFDDVETRLAGLLLDYAEFAGVPSGCGLRIGAAITQSSLALDLGVSRKAVGDALGRFRAQGLLDKRDARYMLQDLTALGALRSRRTSFHHRSG
jgi:CRP-like cAMP-binding protein